MSAPLESSSVLVVSPTVVYVAIAEREQFEKIALVPIDHGVRPVSGRVLTKSLEADGVLVIFQHWIAS